MVGADQRVEYEIGPEREHAERIGIDRLCQHARQRPVGDAEHERREPQPQHDVHVVALDHHVADAAVELRQVADDVEDRQPDERAEDEPVGDVELIAVPPHQRDEDVEAVEERARREHHSDRRHPFAVFDRPARHAYRQGDEPGDQRKIEEPEADFGERHRKQRAARGPIDDEIGDAGEADREPAEQHARRMDRPDAPEGKPFVGQQVRPHELDRRDHAVGRADQEPDRRRPRVGIDDARGGAIIVRQRRRAARLIRCSWWQRTWANSPRAEALLAIGSRR